MGEKMYWVKVRDTVVDMDAFCMVKVEHAGKQGLVKDAQGREVMTNRFAVNGYFMGDRGKFHFGDYEDKATAEKIRDSIMGGEDIVTIPKGVEV